MSTLEIHAAEPSTLALEGLTLDPTLQCRAKGINQSTVREYSEAMVAGSAFPAIVVFRDKTGALLVADGFHRVAAAKLAGLAELPADVREGSRRDALLYAAGANARHGLRRTNADKRRAVVAVLEACSRWSDRRIAEACGVGNKFVGDVRREVCPEHSTEREGQDGKVRQVPSEGEPPNTEPAAGDASLARLSKQLTRLLAAWPPERRGELRTLLESSLAGGG